MFWNENKLQFTLLCYFLCMVCCSSELKVSCPDGFLKLKINLCYSTNEAHTYKEATEICHNSSSYLMDSRFLSKNFHDVADLFPTTFWISERYSYRNTHYSGKSVRLNILKYTYWYISKTFDTHCTVVTFTRSVFKITIEPCNNKKAFVCLHQPLKLLSTTKLLHSWSRLTNQKTCYNIGSKRIAWSEANNTCHAISDTSRILQSFQNLDNYLLFKHFILSIPDSELGTSDELVLSPVTWISFTQGIDLHSWFHLPRKSEKFKNWLFSGLNWEKYAAVLIADRQSGDIYLKVQDPNVKKGFVCEMADCTDIRPTLAYIEDRTEKSAKRLNYSTALDDFKLNCVMSGWYVAESISWYKDGGVIASNSDSNEFGFFHNPRPTTLEDILPYQGYYWCSVYQAQPFKQTHSSKVLFRIQGLHTFVLLMQSFNLSSDLLREYGCSTKRTVVDRNNDLLEFLTHFNKAKGPASVSHVACMGSVLHYYIHIYVQDDKNLVINNEEQVIGIVSSDYLADLVDSNMTLLLEKLQIDKGTLLLRSTVSCQEEKVSFPTYTTTWPTTLMGHTGRSKELCVGAKGNVVERKCLGDFYTGAFWDTIPEECANVFSVPTVTLHQLSKVELTKNNILNSSREMETMAATSSQNLSSADVQYVAQILTNIASVPVIKPKVFSSVISTVDHVIGVKRSRSEDRESPSNVSSTISFAIESMLPNLATNGQVFKEAGSNIAVSVVPLEVKSGRFQTGGILESWNSNLTSLFNGTKEKDLYSSFDAFEAGVLLPENLIGESRAGVKRDVAIIIHKDFHRVENFEVSPVIDVAIGNASVYDIDPPIELIFKVPQTRENVSYLCVFWDQRLNDNYGGWSYKGCTSDYSHSSHVRCFCDHLTSFAVIVEHGPGAKISSIHQITLSFITYIGCGLSLIGLAIIMLTFILFKQWRKDLKHKSLFNLSVALFSFLLIFLVAVEKERNTVFSCILVAVLLHYFMLASFTWMLVEAYIQYLRLVKIIGTYIPRFMQKAVLFAWGVPLVFVGTVFGIKNDLYQSEHKYCWVSEKAFYYAVAGPVLTMLSMNFLIFSIILYSNTCGRSKTYLRNNQSEWKETVTRGKAMFGISILLGLSWVFGFLAVASAKVLFQYLFTITTSVQGFFICTFFVFRQKNTRNRWLSLFKAKPAPETSNTGSTDVTSRGLNKQGQQQDNNKSKVGYRARLSQVAFFNE